MLIIFVAGFIGLFPRHLSFRVFVIWMMPLGVYGSQFLNLWGCEL